MNVAAGGRMAKETIYLCNFRVSVEGDWLCLEELDDVHVNTPANCAAEDGLQLLLLSPENVTEITSCC